MTTTVDAIYQHMEVLEANVQKEINVGANNLVASLSVAETHVYAINLINGAFSSDTMPLIGLQAGYLVRQIATIQAARGDVSPSKANSMKQIGMRIIEQYRKTIVTLSIENMKCGY